MHFNIRSFELCDVFNVKLCNHRPCSECSELLYYPVTGTRNDLHKRPNKLTSKNNLDAQNLMYIFLIELILVISVCKV